MEVKDGKAFATLTDVKNLIGEVFSLADQYGEVLITSYNKPKYAIKRLERSVPVKAEPKKKKAAVEKAVSVPSTPVAVTAPSPVPITSPAAVVIPQAVMQPPIAVQMPPKPTVIPAAPAPVPTTLGGVVWWDRNNSKEQAWVERSRKLL